MEVMLLSTGAPAPNPKRCGPSTLRCLGAVPLLLLLGLAGCAPSRSVVPVNLHVTNLQPPTDAEDLRSPEAAVRGIAAIMVRDLGLIVPERVTVYVYSGREVFEQGLIRDADIAPARAAELSDFAVGVGKRRQLLLHDEPGMGQGAEWLRLIAHELTHVTQIEIAHGEGRAEQWLAEGMAEWVAFSVLERLSLDSLNRRRAVAVAGVRAQAALQAGRLDLETLGTPRGFTMRHLREGSLPTYQLSFLMVEYLIQRDGFPRLVAYFEAVARSRDRRANFRRAFGQSVEQFEGEVTEYLEMLVHEGEAGDFEAFAPSSGAASRR
jgi:hypothetical protein